MTPLGPGYEPNEHDIICARGRSVYNHEGNQKFRGILRDNLERYKTATTKQQKTTVVNTLLDEIKEENRFIRKLSDGKWVEVPEHVAKEKIGQGFRDLLHTEYRSSTKSKVKLRRERRRRMKKLEEQGAPVPDASTDVEGHRSSNSIDFLEPLPLDESSEALLMSEFNFASRSEEEKILGAEIAGKTAADEDGHQEDLETKGPREDKIAPNQQKSSTLDAAARPPPPPAPAVERSTEPVPTFVSPLSPPSLDHIRTRHSPRPRRSPGRHEHPPHHLEPYYSPHYEPGRIHSLPHYHHYPAAWSPYNYPPHHLQSPHQPPSPHVDYRHPSPLPSDPRSHPTHPHDHSPHRTAPPGPAWSQYPPYWRPLPYALQPAWSDYHPSLNPNQPLSHQGSFSEGDGKEEDGRHPDRRNYYYLPPRLDERQFGPPA